MPSDDNLVANREAGENDAGRGGAVELAHEIMMGLHRPDRVRQAEHGRPLGPVEIAPILQLAKQRIEGGPGSRGC